MKRMIWAVAVITILGSQPVWAARMPVHDAAESPQYGRKFGGMIGRGVLNVATCFVDVLVNLVNETKAGPPVVGTLTGAAKGTGCGILRLGSGAVDLVTFWVPGFNGFPVSDSYDNCFAVNAPMAATPEPTPSAAPQPAATWQSPPAEPAAATSTAPASSAPPPKPAHKRRRWTK